MDHHSSFDHINRGRLAAFIAVAAICLMQSINLALLVRLGIHDKSRAMSDVGPALIVGAALSMLIGIAAARQWAYAVHDHLPSAILPLASLTSLLAMLASRLEGGEAALIAAMIPAVGGFVMAVSFWGAADRSTALSIAIGFMAAGLLIGAGIKSPDANSAWLRDMLSLGGGVTLLVAMALARIYRRL